MSFSTNVKNEISRIIPEDDRCKKAELSGMIRVGGSITIGSKMQMALEMRTENAATARKFLTMVKTAYGIETEINILRRNRLKKNNIYIVKITDSENAKGLLVDLGISDDGFLVNSGISQGVNPEIFAELPCKRAFIRGLFLGSGSVTDPDLGYHLEVVFGSRDIAQVLVDLLADFDLSAKITQRKNTYLAYLKESEQISTFLSIIEAHNALFSLENTRIQKEMRNQVNRLVNCETANMNKSIDAAFRQIDNIEVIDNMLGLDKLPDNLKELAFLRLENPDKTLKELGEMLNPPVGKSGVNHRMRKIESIAKSYIKK